MTCAVLREKYIAGRAGRTGKVDSIRAVVPAKCTHHSVVRPKDRSDRETVRSEASRYDTEVHGPVSVPCFERGDISVGRGRRVGVLAKLMPSPWLAEERWDTRRCPVLGSLGASSWTLVHTKGPCNSSFYILHSAVQVSLPLWAPS